MAVVRVASRVVLGRPRTRSRGVESGNREGGRTVTSGKEARRRRAHRRARNQPTLSCPARGRGLVFSYRAEGAETRKNENCFRAAVVNQGHLATGSSARCYGVGGRVHVVAVAPQ